MKIILQPIKIEKTRSELRDLFLYRRNKLLNKVGTMNILETMNHSYNKKTSVLTMRAIIMVLLNQKEREGWNLRIKKLSNISLKARIW